MFSMKISPNYPTDHSCQEERIRNIKAKIDELYKQMDIKSRLPHLDLKTFKNEGEYPRLRAKANDSRHLLPVLDKLLELDTGEDLYRKVRKQMLQSLLAFYKVVSTTSMFLEPSAIQVGRDAINSFLKCYSWLCKDAVDKGQRKWQMTIKFHYLAHVPDQLQWLNVKYGSTYAAESYVGKVAKIGGSCLMGRSPWEVGGLLMQKVQTSKAVQKRKAM